MRAINAVRRAGSIANAVRDGIVRDGIMHACVVEGVPFLLCGSIRDDGPLPDVITDAVAAQDAMRAHTIRATDGGHDRDRAAFDRRREHAPRVLRRPPMRGIVELSDDLRGRERVSREQAQDRGTHQAVGVVTNAQDFMSILRATVEQEIAGSG